MASEYSQVTQPAQLFEPTIDHTPIASYGDATAPSSVRKWKYHVTDTKFDPDVHLQLEEPGTRLKLSDFGYDNEKDGIFETAAVTPFRLFSDEAIRLIRNDLFSEEVQSGYVRTSTRAPYQVRGYAPEVSKFIYDAWTHPRTLAAISEAAGLELMPFVDYEIGHVNVQLGPKGPEGVKDIEDMPAAPLGPDQRLPPSEFDNRPVDDWHFDGTPFVAVLMLSNTVGMDGGETAVMHRDGTVSKIPSPSMGKVAIMQGSRVRHAALRAQNCSERIAMVCALRPRNPFLDDPSKLPYALTISDPHRFTMQWLDYRLQVLHDRFKIQQERLSAADAYEKQDVVDFVRSANDFMTRTVTEMYPEELTKADFM